MNITAKNISWLFENVFIQNINHIGICYYDLFVYDLKLTLQIDTTGIPI